MSIARQRSLSVTADGASNQTPWLSAYKGLNITISGTFVATATLQRKDNLGNISDVTDNAGTAITFTAPKTYNLPLNDVGGDYRLNCKSGSFTSGPMLMLLEGH